MSWGQHHPGPSEPNPDPFGRTPTSNEPDGFVHHDPYASPGYGQAGAHDPGYAPGHSWPGYGPYHRQTYVYQYDPVHPPRPAVGFLEAIKLFFKNYAVFYGRASRSEYWWLYVAWLLLTIVAVVPIVGVMVVVGTNSPEPPMALIAYVLSLMLLSLGLVVPTISLQVRRLHDAGFSGFFSIFAYVPYLNYITFLVPLIMSAMPSRPEGVKYDNPDGSQPVTG